MKGTFIMPKDTDEVVKQFDGYANVSALAKMGTAFFKRYDNAETLLKNEAKEHVVKMFNRMTRVDAINTVNRPEATPSAIRELGKLAKASDAETQAAIEKATLKIIADAKAKAELNK